MGEAGDSNQDLSGSDGREVRSSDSERKSSGTDQEIALEDAVVEDKERDDEVGDDETGEGSTAMGPTSLPPDTMGRSATVGDFGPSPGGGGIGEG